MDEDDEIRALTQLVHHHLRGEPCNDRCGTGLDLRSERLVPIPHLTADEIQVLLHGLNKLQPSFDITRHLDTFLPDEIKPIVDSLATALLEALSDARR